MADIVPLIPRQHVPDLSLSLVGGRSWSLQGAAPKKFSLLAFYRGWHCPLCREQLRDLQSRLYDFERLGVAVVVISTDDERRATSTKHDWGLDRLQIAFGLDLKQARQWGLYVSTGKGATSLGIEEPNLFNEPGLFLINPDRTLYYAAVQSVPFARPSTHDLVKAIEFVVNNDYPARGEVIEV